MLPKRSKRKPIQKTRSEVYRSNHNAFGDEYTYENGHEISESEKGRAYSWYAYMSTPDEAKQYLLDYLERKNHQDLIPAISKISSNNLPLTACWLARIDELGAEIGKSHDFIIKKIKEVCGSALVASKDEAIEEKKPQKTSRVDMLAGNMIADIDDVIDRSDWNHSVYDALKSKSFPPTVAGQIAGHFKRLYDETVEVLEGDDKQLSEAYRLEKKAETRARRDWLRKVLDDCAAYGKNERKLKAPRKKKPVSIEKKIKNMVYCKESLEYKLVSLDPSKIIGSKEVYLFNTKYKTITVLLGESLDVRGKSIIGFSDESYTRSCGRKAQDIVTRLAAGGKVATGPALDMAKGEKRKPKSLVDANTVILRATR